MYCSSLALWDLVPNQLIVSRWFLECQLLQFRNMFRNVFYSCFTFVLRYIKWTSTVRVYNTHRLDVTLVSLQITDYSKAHTRFLCPNNGEYDVVDRFGAVHALVGEHSHPNVRQRRHHQARTVHRGRGGTCPSPKPLGGGALGDTADGPHSDAL